MGCLIQLFCTLKTLIRWLAPGNPVNPQYVQPWHAFDGGV